jgi:hypothetical protein
MIKKNCAEIVNQKYLDTVNDYQLANDYFNLNDEDKSKHDKHEDLQSYEDLFDYVNQSALGFDFVSVNTFKGQDRGYWRFQMSWGGPSDEFRIYVDEENQIEYIDYHYLDWFDGASVRARHDIIYNICQTFLEGCDCKDLSEIYKEEEMGVIA